MNSSARPTPESARTSPTAPHYRKAEAERLAIHWAERDETNRLAREDAQRAPVPEFLAVYRHADGIQYRRCIYALFDPREPAVVCYVGQTTRHPISRLDGHISDALRLVETPQWARPCARTTWIAGLIQAGLTPSLGVIQVVPAGEDLSAVEQHWIRFYRYRGEAKANGTIRGAAWHGLKARP